MSLVLGEVVLRGLTDAVAAASITEWLLRWLLGCGVIGNCDCRNAATSGRSTHNSDNGSQQQILGCMNIWDGFSFDGGRPCWSERI